MPFVYTSTAIRQEEQLLMHSAEHTYPKLAFQAWPNPPNTPKK